MTAIRPERLGAVPEKPGPEIYAPNRKSSEKSNDISQDAATAFEGEVREFVRRDVALLRRQRPDGEAASEPVADNLHGLIRRVSSASMEEIDREIGRASCRERV